MEDFFTRETGRRLILSGAAAAARGAYEAGAGLVLTYPGSPVVESFEILAAQGSPAADRCRIIINEHVAWHQALGYCLAGGRSFIIMKHVGINVAADPMHYSAYTGVNGGMVILAGSDPGANCSTGEFDIRFYSLHAHIPIIEPRDFNETVSSVRNAFDISERYKLPVMVIIPSALCYGVGTARSGPVADAKRGTAFVNSRDYTCVGPLAVRRHELLMKKIAGLREAPLSCEEPSLKSVFDSGGSGALIVTSGIYYDFVKEALRESGLESAASVYAPIVTYPLNEIELLGALRAHDYKKVIFIEDLEGFLELTITSFMAENQISAEICGKNKSDNFGELKYPAVKEILQKLLSEDYREPARPVFSLEPEPREGTFCPGCPHRAFFYALTKYLAPDDVIGGDIGCSSLPPHFSSWLTCMNSGASIASGTSLAARGGNTDGGRTQKTVSLIGDSTFFHSGMQTILECSASDSNQICFILDNGWTAMTGHQPTFTTKPAAGSEKSDERVSIKKILEAFGVKRIYEADPYRIDRLMALLNELTSDGREGFTAVIVRRECRLQAKKRAAAKNANSGAAKTEIFEIISERCAQCNECYSVLTCPAIFKNAGGDLYINHDICDGCGVCRQICPNGAIARIEARS